MIYIFLPALNEALALPLVVNKFVNELNTKKEKYQFIVFDDGSTDNMHQIAAELASMHPMIVLSHDKNQGLGQTMIDGINFLVTKVSDDDLIVTMDCDNTHEPKYLTAALKKIREGYDVILLSRFQKGGGQRGLSWFQNILSMNAGRFLKILFPIHGVREYSCNYRIYRGHILKKAKKVFGDRLVRLPHMGFAVTPELLIKLRMLKAKIGESPFVLRYDKKPTISTKRTFDTIKGYFTLAFLYVGRKIYLDNQ
jgi:dolichol-phosphate mannosyltransferase